MKTEAKGEKAMKYGTTNQVNEHRVVAGKDMERDSSLEFPKGAACQHRD